MVVCYDQSLSYKFMLSWRFISSAISSPAALLRNERVLSKQNYYHFTPSVVRLSLGNNQWNAHSVHFGACFTPTCPCRHVDKSFGGSPTNMVLVWKSPEMICIIKLPVELVYSISLYISVLNTLYLWNAVRLLSMGVTQVYYTTVYRMKTKKTQNEPIQ